MVERGPRFFSGRQLAPGGIVSRGFVILILCVGVAGAVLLGFVFEQRLATADEYHRQVRLALEEAKRIREQVILPQHEKLSAGQNWKAAPEKFGLSPKEAPAASCALSPNFSSAAFKFWPAESFSCWGRITCSRIRFASSRASLTWRWYSSAVESLCSKTNPNNTAPATPTHRISMTKPRLTIPPGANCRPEKNRGPRSTILPAMGCQRNAHTRFVSTGRWRQIRIDQGALNSSIRRFHRKARQTANDGRALVKGSLLRWG